MLQAIDTSEWKANRSKQHVKELHQLFVDHLPGDQPPADSPPAVSASG